MQATRLLLQVHHRHRNLEETWKRQGGRDTAFARRDFIGLAMVISLTVLKHPEQGISQSAAVI